MTGLLPLIFALAILDSSRPKIFAGVAQHPWSWWLWLFAISLAVWLLVCETVTRVLLRSRRRHWVEQWDLLAHGLMLGYLAWICYRFGWTTRVQAYTPAILPWLALQAVHWWILAFGLRPRPELKGWSRAGMIRQQVRFGMMPILLILPIFDCCNWLTLRSGLQQYLMHHLGAPITMGIGTLALGIFAPLLMPLVLVRMWHAQPLPPSELRELLEAACRHMRVRVRGLMLWPGEVNKIYNAAVIGVLPQLRYVLFSQDLLRDFPPRQILAVLGHELGHARYWHLPLYMLFVLVTLMTSFLLAAPLTTALGHVAWFKATSPELREGLATVALLGVKWRLIFGYLSRACERQADLSGAELSGGPATMRDALRTVARLSGQAETTPSWRHYSIGERAAFLDRVELEPGLAQRHHAQVRIWWRSLSALALALSVILGIITLRNPAAW